MNDTPFWARMIECLFNLKCSYFTREESKHSRAAISAAPHLWELEVEGSNTVPLELYERTRALAITACLRKPIPENWRAIVAFEPVADKEENNGSHS